MSIVMVIIDTRITRTIGERAKRKGLMPMSLLQLTVLLSLATITCNSLESDNSSFSSSSDSIEDRRVEFSPISDIACVKRKRLLASAGLLSEDSGDFVDGGDITAPASLAHVTFNSATKNLTRKTAWEEEAEEIPSHSFELLPEERLNIQRLKQKPFIAFIEDDIEDLSQRAEADVEKEDESVPLARFIAELATTLPPSEVAMVSTLTSTRRSSKPSDEFASEMPTNSSFPSTAKTFEEFPFKVGRNFVPKSLFTNKVELTAAPNGKVVKMLIPPIAVPVVTSTLPPSPSPSTSPSSSSTSSATPSTSTVSPSSSSSPSPSSSSPLAPIIHGNSLNPLEESELDESHGRTEQEERRERTHEELIKEVEKIERGAEEDDEEKERDPPAAFSFDHDLHKESAMEIKRKFVDETREEMIARSFAQKSKQNAKEEEEERQKRTRELLPLKADQLHSRTRANNKRTSETSSSSRESSPETSSISSGSSHSRVSASFRRPHFPHVLRPLAGDRSSITMPPQSIQERKSNEVFRSTLPPFFSTSSTKSVEHLAKSKERRGTMTRRLGKRVNRRRGRKSKKTLSTNSRSLLLPSLLPRPSSLPIAQVPERASIGVKAARNEKKGMLRAGILPIDGRPLHFSVEDTNNLSEPLPMAISVKQPRVPPSHVPLHVRPSLPSKKTEKEAPATAIHRDDGHWNERNGGWDEVGGNERHPRFVVSLPAKKRRKRLLGISKRREDQGSAEQKLAFSSDELPFPMWSSSPMSLRKGSLTDADLLKNELIRLLRRERRIRRARERRKKRIITQFLLPL